MCKSEQPADSRHGHGNSITCGRGARAGIVAQGFALIGTIVGIFTIAIGVGPRSFADVIYHIIIVCVLIYGVQLALRARSGGFGATYG